MAGVDAASLHILEGGLINDWLGSIAASTSSSNFATIMTSLQTKDGDVLILGPTRSATSGSPSQTDAVQQASVDAVAALANGTTKAFYDLKTGVGDYAAMSAAGRMADTLHPNNAGSVAEAAAVFWGDQLRRCCVIRPAIETEIFVRRDRHFTAHRAESLPSPLVHPPLLVSKYPERQGERAD